MSIRRRLLVIGAIPNPSNLKSYGGCTILMKNFIDWMDDKGISYTHINTSRFNNAILNILYVLVSYIYYLPFHKVIMFNMANNGAFFVFYYLSPLAFLFNKKVVFRKFAGTFDKKLLAISDNKRKAMINRLNKCSLCFFETKTLVEKMQNMLLHKDRIKWFPNCRSPFGVKKENSSFNKKICFISHVRESKGVDYLLEASNLLPDGYIIDIYGSIHDDKYRNLDFFKPYKAQYKGALKSEEVPNVLSSYDLIILPTFWSAEGYPGIIIEAMSLGLPSITTYWGGLPELIANGENGLFVPIKDSNAIAKAILSIDEEKYIRMSKAAKERFDKYYNSDTINKEVYKSMIELYIA